jgi:hypothetical protein
VAQRGRKPTGNALTATERSRRFRQQHAKTRSFSIEEQALQNTWGRRAACFALTTVKDELAEALGNRPEGIEDKRGFILGHKVGLEQAIAAIDRQLEWIRPLRARYVADSI